MKKLSVLISLILCFCLCVTANATQIPDGSQEETTVSEELTPSDAPSRFLGDVNGDGDVTSGDARILLRCSVSLESLEGLNLAYGDMTFDGTISAPDARMALRTAVKLEEKQSYSFVVTESKSVSCTDVGFVKAVCVKTGKTAEVQVKQRNHVFTEEAYCNGRGICQLCKQSYDLEVKHSYQNRYDVSLKECRICGHTEPLNHKHSFAVGNCVCGINAKTALERHLRDYVTKNGTHEDTLYYISEYYEPVNFAVMYDTTVGFANAYYGFGVNQDGTVFYYDFYFDFEENTIEAIMFTEDGTSVAYAYGNINSPWVDIKADGDAITLTEYDAIPELNGYEGAFRQMMEGAVYDTVSWLRDFAPRTGFAHTGHAFSDFNNVQQSF